MSANPEAAVRSKFIPKWCGAVLVLVAVVTAGAGVQSLVELWPDMHRNRALPRLDADQVNYLASGSRGKTRWLTEFDETGRRIGGVEIPPDVQNQNFERLILTLLPIRDEERVALPGTKYQITIMIGNRGATILVGHKSGGDVGELLAEYHDRCYSGGNWADFKTLAESILPKPQEVDLIPQDSGSTR